MTGNGKNSVLVRPANENDIPVLGEMGCEFQDYINSLNRPGEPAEPASLTAEAFRRDGFGDDPWFSVLIAERAGDPMGYLLYHFGYWADRGARSLVVSDLFVREAARGRGIGTALMHEATRILRRRGGDLILWTVWNRNTPARAFYEGLGASTEGEELFMLWPANAWPSD